MLRLASYDIVFQEIPGEVTLALNLSGCPNRCPGCHSAYLQTDTGEALTDGLLMGLLGQYGDAVTCVCFMGGDSDPREVERMALRVRETSGGGLKTGWYSGRDSLPARIRAESFDYIKLGCYVEAFGGLNSKTTNQRLYEVGASGLTDITHRFHQKP